MGEKVYTEFGKYLALHAIPYTAAANDLGVTRSYVSMLATGKATPGLLLAGQIEDWSDGVITMRCWYDWLRVNDPRAAQATAPDAE